MASPIQSLKRRPSRTNQDGNAKKVKFAHKSTGLLRGGNTSANNQDEPAEEKVKGKSQSPKSKDENKTIAGNGKVINTIKESKTIKSVTPSTTPGHEDSSDPNDPESAEPQQEAAEPELPPDSVGPIFSAPLPADPQLLTLLKAPLVRAQDRPLGFNNWGATHCYANALLAMLLNSDRFMKYVNEWHMTEEHKKCGPDEMHILQHFHSIFAAMGADDQSALDAAMQTFWTTAAFCTDRKASVRDTLTWGGKTTQQQRPKESKTELDMKYDQQQQDSSELFHWLMETISTQFETGDVYGNPPRRFAEYVATQNYQHTCMPRITERVVCYECQHVVRKRLAMDESTMIHPYAPLPRAEPQAPVAGESLNIKEYTTLEACLEKFCEDRQMSNYYCYRCGNRVTATYIRQFSHAPEVLTFQLPRLVQIKQHDNSLIEQKDGTVIRIPDNLD
ncbi:hypothetical protein LTR66_017862, partial [Elasticomyces elasticus]